MRIAVLSDIHANRLALEAVLADSLKQNVDLYWFLGDLVGYGPNPIEALKWLKGEFDGFPAPDGWVMGNHDAMLADLVLQGKSGAADAILNDPINYPVSPGLVLPDDLTSKDEDTRLLDFVIRQKDSEGQVTQRELYRGKGRGKFLNLLDWGDLNGAAPVLAIELNRAALMADPVVDDFWKEAFTPGRKTPREYHIEGVDYILAHSGQVNPLFRYIYAWSTVLLNDEFRILYEQATRQGHPRVQFLGHTHVPTLVFGRPNSKEDGFDFDAKYIIPGETYPLDPGEVGQLLALINPGSVGQPRDLDYKRAAYAILDTTGREVTFQRVAYDYEDAASLLTLNRYPARLRDMLISARQTSRTPTGWLAYYELARGKSI